MSIATTPATKPNLHFTRRGKLVIATLTLILFAVCLTIVWNHLAGREAVATENQLPETYQQIEIGRASCRERVESRGGAGAGKREEAKTEAEEPAREKR